MRDGYTVVPRALGDDLCSAVVRDVEAFKTRNRWAVRPHEDEHGRLSRVVNLHLLVDSLAAVFSENPAIAVCDRFFDAEASLYTSLYFERGSEQALHRDSPLFATRPPGRYLGVWAALEDVDARNGPLVVVPGSHLLPALDVESMGRKLYGDPKLAPATSEAGWDMYQSAVQAQAAAADLSALEVHVRRGDVIVWHPLLLHGGAPHRSPHRSRRSLVMHVTPVGVPVYHQDVFFDSGKDVSAEAEWTYYQENGRRIAKFSEIDFAHQAKVDVDVLDRPAASLSERVRTRIRRIRRRLS